MRTQLLKSLSLSMLASLFAVPSASLAQQSTLPVTTPIASIAPIAVSDVLPGPALWKVTRDGHVMWILGVTNPLPKRMQWETAVIERVVADSQIVLKAPGLEVGAHVGFWGRISLIPSMLGIKNLPNDQTLRDVLSPELYARWDTQRAKYLVGKSADRLRPIFAGKELYAAAIKRSDLTDDSDVQKRVLSFAKQDDVPVEDTSYIVITENPRADAKLFKKVSMADQQCLSGILDAAEQDLSRVTVRANAWATGDLAALREILATHQQDDCLSALGNTEFAQKMGMTDIAQRIEDAWLRTVESSMATHQQVTAILPIDRLLAAHGYLTALQAKGYVVTEPQE